MDMVTFDRVFLVGLCVVANVALNTNETTLQPRATYNILECVHNALPAHFLAPVETRLFVDDLTTMSVANSEDDVTRSICSVALERTRSSP